VDPSIPIVNISPILVRWDPVTNPDGVTLPLQAGGALHPVIDQIERLASELSERYDRLDGFVHSIAFADYGDSMKPFHETR
jgi:enoyl-[acyl-carrier-protein] reductase (NADH)